MNPGFSQLAIPTGQSPVPLGNLAIFISVVLRKVVLSHCALTRRNKDAETSVAEMKIHNSIGVEF